MPKQPQWFDKKPHAQDGPGATLASASRVLREEARIYRKMGNKDAAKALEKSADSMLKVSIGHTWRAAFEIPQPPKDEA